MTRPAGAAEGTSVEVRDLFFNVPARRKFLKSTGTEAAHVSEAMLLAALARPDVSFFLVRDGRAAREWLRVGSRARARRAGHRRASASRPASASAGPMRIEAHLAPPERARAGAVGLHLLVNGRPVRDRPLARAVAQAYGSVLEPGRYPVGVVYVDLPPDQVDVNVHPQKAEVRFADGRALFDAVTRELHLALARAFNLPALGTRQAVGHAAPAAVVEPTPPTTRFVREPGRAAALAGSRGTSRPPSETRRRTKSLAERTTLTSVPDADLRARRRSSPAGLFEGAGFYASLEFLAQVRAHLPRVQRERRPLRPRPARRGRARDLPPAAAGVRRSRRWRRSGCSSPTSSSSSPAEVATLEEHARRWRRSASSCGRSGPSAVAVHAVPTLLARARPERIVRDLGGGAGTRGARGPSATRPTWCWRPWPATAASARATSLSREEAVALLRALDDIDFAGHCPHGRPVVTRIGYDELERRVGR